MPVFLTIVGSAAVKLKSAEVKGKLLEYIVNPGGCGETERHVSSKDKLGRRYRNLAPLFSIDDEHEPQGITPVLLLEFFCNITF